MVNVAGVAATSGRWREPARVPLRAAKKFFTMRSSSEWNDTTTSRPPGVSTRSAAESASRQFAEFVVDEQPQRLERARRRMNLAGLAAHHAPDQIGQRLGGDNRRFVTRPHNRPRTPRECRSSPSR